MPLATINYLLALGTAASQVFLVLGAVLMFFQKPRKFIANALGKNGLLLAWLVALASTAFSLFYSELAGFEPCKLCWYQRIFMYPQIILLGLALLKKDFKIADYALPLAYLGAVVALYHNYIYYGGTSLFPCGAFGLGASCTRRYVFELGYITIPLMSLTAFALVIFFLAVQKFYNHGGGRE